MQSSYLPSDGAALFDGVEADWWVVWLADTELRPMGGSPHVAAPPRGVVPAGSRQRLGVRAAPERQRRRNVALFRRDHDVRLPIADIDLRSANGIPYLAPEVVLLYKAKQQREHDELDLAAALPLLSPRQRGWLRAGIERVHPGHPWLDRLKTAS